MPALLTFRLPDVSFFLLASFLARSQQTLTPSTLDWPQPDLLFSMPCCFWPQCLIGWIFGKKAAYETSAEHRKTRSCLKSPSLCQYIHLSHLSCWASPLPLLIRLLLRHVIWEGTWWWKKKNPVVWPTVEPAACSDRSLQHELFISSVKKGPPPYPDTFPPPCFFLPFFQCTVFHCKWKRIKSSAINVCDACVLWLFVHPAAIDICDDCLSVWGPFVR